jgi:hypothetical protein
VDLGKKGDLAVSVESDGWHRLTHGILLVFGSYEPSPPAPAFAVRARRADRAWALALAWVLTARAPPTARPPAACVWDSMMVSARGEHWPRGGTPVSVFDPVISRSPERRTSSRDAVRFRTMWRGPDLE